jgi:arginine exporter protein ArgO
VNLLGALVLGLALGAITGMPLGVINVAIAEAAIAGRRAYAAGMGLGGALADTVHALLAMLGLARLVTARPEIVRVLAVVAALVIVSYAVLGWRRQRTPPAACLAHDGGVARGVGAGLALTLPNPGALTGWVAIAAALWPHAEVVEALAFALGVGVGSAVWFVALGRLIAHMRRDHPALRLVPKLALVLFVAIAIVGVARVV